MNQLTTIYKKSSWSGKLSVYLPDRKFATDPLQPKQISGVVLVHPDYINRGYNVYFRFTTALRYGRVTDNLRPSDELKILAELYKTSQMLQPFPFIRSRTSPKVTEFQKKILKNSGRFHPFKFFLDLPANLPQSVNFEPEALPLLEYGVDHEIQFYIAKYVDDPPQHVLDCFTLIARKILQVPSSLKDVQTRPSTSSLSSSSLGWNRLEPIPVPMMEVSKSFSFSPKKKKLYLEVNLNKEYYYFGEPMEVHLRIENDTSRRTVERVKIEIIQYTNVYHQSINLYENVVLLDVIKCSEGFPVGPGQIFHKLVRVKAPTIKNVQVNKGIAFDGNVEEIGTELASSTILNEKKGKKGEKSGIFVEYKVKVTVIMDWFRFGGDLSLELIFKLMNKRSHNDMTDESGLKKDEARKMAYVQEHPQAYCSVYCSGESSKFWRKLQKTPLTEDNNDNDQEDDDDDDDGGIYDNVVYENYDEY